MRESLDPTDPLDPLQYRRLRAPQQHGGVFVAPPLHEAGAALRRNLKLRSESLPAWVDPQLATAARREVLQLARDYTSQYRNCDWLAGRSPDEPTTPWIVTGHQPRLYHPGVWIKNFALSKIAADHQAVPLNLVVDNDLCADAALRVPVKTAEGHWRQQTISWDKSSQAVPFEQRYVHDPKQFHSFAQRAAAAAHQFSDTPLLEELWPIAKQRQLEGRPVGECFAMARHTIEANIGLRTLEVPLGKMFDLSSARQWTARMLEDLPRLHRIYNSALSTFRQTHRVRSRAHPVPDLGADEDWLEAPFWVWSAAAPQRLPLWVRRREGHVQLSDGQSQQVSGDNAISALEAMSKTHRVRPRALMTTLFLRTVIGDLFLHGIGGAKYDQLTDAIILEFFAAAAPAYLTLTATFRLDDPPLLALRQEVSGLRRRLRELQFNPQRHLGDSPEEVALVQEKADLLGQDRDLAARHHALKRVNEAMQVWVEPLREPTRQQLEQTVIAVREAQISGNREYSFVWHNAQELPRQLLDLCQETQ